jgi:RND family efflux transporter MFP subunit
MTASELRSALWGGLFALAGGWTLTGVAAEPDAERVFVGVIRPAEPVTVTSGVAGTVAMLRVDEGDVVKAGDVLAELDSTRARLELDRAKAKLDVARAKLVEAKVGLRGDDVGLSSAKERVAIAEAELRLAEAEVKLAQYGVDATQLRAPRDGTVLARHAVVGQVVDPRQGDGSGARLFELADLSKLEVVVNLPQSRVGTMRPDRPCRVETGAGPNAVYQGKVARVSPVAEPQTGMVPVRMQVAPSENGSRLMPGMTVNVVFGGEE